MFKSRQENVPNFGVKPDKRETKINMVTSLLSCVQFLPCNTAITLYAVAEKKNQSASNEIFIDFLLSKKEKKKPPNPSQFYM